MSSKQISACADADACPHAVPTAISPTGVCSDVITAIVVVSVLLYVRKGLKADSRLCSYSSIAS